MALAVTHTKVSAVVDSANTDEVQGSDWNAAHVLTGVATVAQGGTGQATYAVGDLLYASTTTALAKLAGVAAGQVLVSGGVATAPVWSASPTLTSLVVGGTTAPSGVEGYFASTSASDPRGVMSAQYSTDAIGARLHLRKARGTEAAPTTIVTGDVLGRVRVSGYDGATYLQMASIDVVATGTIATTRVPTYLTLSVATDATPSVLTEVLRLTPTLLSSSVPATWAGLHTFNGGVTVNGSVTLTGVVLTGVLTTTVDAIATTPTDGAVYQNTTPATSGVPIQISPRVRWSATGWDTDDAVSRTMAWGADVTGASGTVLTSIWRLLYTLDAGGAATPFSLTGAGALTITGGLTCTNVVASGVVQAGASNIVGWAGLTRLVASVDAKLQLWNNGLTIGVGLDFATDTVLKVRTTAQSAYATVDCLGLKASGVAGVSFGPAHPASITIVNGIVTACS